MSRIDLSYMNSRVVGCIGYDPSSSNGVSTINCFTIIKLHSPLVGLSGLEPELHAYEARALNLCTINPNKLSVHAEA